MASYFTVRDGKIDTLIVIRNAPASDCPAPDSLPLHVARQGYHRGMSGPASQGPSALRGRELGWGGSV